MTIAEDVADFLVTTEQPIARAFGLLDFFVEDFHVDPEGYREIGHKIRHQAITVEPVSASSGSRLAAAYTPGLNKLSVAPDLNLASIPEQAQVVHEVTHALMDFHRYQTTELMDEIAAYVAGALYAAALQRTMTSRDQYSMAILRNALAIVRDRDMVNRRGARLRRRDTDVGRLAQAIESHPSYSGAGQRPNFADGIPLGEHGLINPWYEPRH